MTLVEAAELSRLLQEKWGMSASEPDDEPGDIERDFIAPLTRRLASLDLVPPAEHLSTVRADLARALAR